jgi:hypothetical protein
MLYFALVNSKLEREFVAWKTVTITDSNKFERIKENMEPFATLDFAVVEITVTYD